MKRIFYTQLYFLFWARKFRGVGSFPKAGYSMMMEEELFFGAQNSIWLAYSENGIAHEIPVNDPRVLHIPKKELRKMEQARELWCPLNSGLL